MGIAEPSRPKILVVESSYPAAVAVCDMVVKHGCDIAGMVGELDKAIAFARDNALDGAVIDTDLRGTASFPICEQLRKRDIPFVLTGTGAFDGPEEFRTAPWLHKPVDDRELGLALAGLARPAVAPGSRGNLILERLRDEDWSAMQPHLEQVALSAGEILNAAGDVVSHVYFPTTGLVSVFARNGRGKAVEVALVGREGATGVAPILGKTQSAGLESVVHVAGTAWRIAASELMPLLADRPGLRAELLAAVHAFVGEMSDTAVSMGSGTIEQRLARRLLMASLRLGNRELALTHEALARLLAVRRSGITVALHMLESRRTIRSRRNLVEILDYESLALAAGDAGARLMDTEVGAPPSQ
ncbi:MAG: helix-turn-helix domain-containing protein [Reyranella sp.]|uniref:helix-turn-helix domain-containing protein n=1 Tax=Reyranella sp. TaxID=1929291 RepID=UPI001ACDB5E5|nr:helix-turn-helix domain-containing protein [Reyranella sp.]MBN9086594.1 helix-turn-helix domain-containing protein [Reyranella sp.]